MEKEGEIRTQHYAFLLTEREFDQIFAHVKEQGLTHWADPARTKTGEINRHDDGRGVYFEDPSGHLLEVITRPYGSSDRDR
jgi:catechol 2,3-dioxygenase-like lactoylglutathione lyase family enzyme